VVPIVDRTFIFAEKILEGYLILRENSHFRLADQFVSAGTSIGANVEEAQAAHSKLDFIRFGFSEKGNRGNYFDSQFDYQEIQRQPQRFPALKFATF